MKKVIVTAEQVTDHFVSYICETKTARDSRHVRRVLAWLGFIIKGIERIADEFYVTDDQTMELNPAWGYSRKRQFWFRVGGQNYKVRYSHSLRGGSFNRGGLEIVSMPDWKRNGDVVLQIRNLNQAEAFYNRPSLTPSVRVKEAA